MPCEAKPIPTPQAGNIVKSSGTLRVTKPDIWYVAYGPNKAIQTDGKGHYARATKTFHSEIEAQIFAAQLLAEGWSVSAGTLNPHEPKKIITLAVLKLVIGQTPVAIAECGCKSDASKVCVNNGYPRIYSASTTDTFQI